MFISADMRPERTDCRRGRADFWPKRVRPDKADFRPYKTDFRYGRADFRSERTDFRLEREEFRPEMADIRPEMANFRLERPMGGMGGWDVRTDEWTEE